MQNVISYLNREGMRYQVAYDDGEVAGAASGKIPTEVYTRDPAGTVVGFTVRRNIFAQTVPSSVVNQRAETEQAKAAPETGGADADDKGPRRSIGVLTSGGDAPGMNAFVRAVVRMAIFQDCEAFTIYEGYEGLIQGGDLIKRTTWGDVRGWLSEGGTLIGSARCMGFKERKGRLRAAKNLITAGIDSLIVCGGDGSLTGADVFRSEYPGLVAELLRDGEITADQAERFKHLTIVGAVGSIDNDMSSTDSTIGAFSSLHRICEAVDSISSTALSHSRAFVIEVMGRHCGWLAIMAAVSTGADYVFVPEIPPDTDWRAKMASVLRDARALGKRKSIVIVAEGAIDSDLNPITAEEIKNTLSNDLKIDTRITTLGHIQRGGEPCAFDRMLATLQGVESVNAVLESTPETPSPMIAINENNITRKDLMEAVRLTKKVAAAISERDFCKAMELRDPEFAEMYNAYLETTMMKRESAAPEHEKQMRVGIIHVGAPAGGMNAATRAAIRALINQGHRPFAIQNGFPGFLRHDEEAVVEMSWMDTDGWTMRGGSEIGTNRALPDMDLGYLAWLFQKYRFDALMIVGGFEAYTALCQLEESRKNYPAFRIPMVCLPATISNNVPGTDFSIGSDTCLNAIMLYCDAIKQSASASRRRVFVCEVQGGNSGYVAVLAGLIVGAIAVYTPEDGINLKTLSEDIEHLRKTFATDRGQNRGGKLIIRNEKASTVYTTQVVADIIREEAKGRFESRTAIPGHVQQGGTPSPMDRIRAARLAIKCVDFLQDCRDQNLGADSSSACVIGIRGASVRFTPVQDLDLHDTERKFRRPRHVWWKDIRRLDSILNGLPIREKP